MGSCRSKVAIGPEHNQEIVTVEADPPRETPGTEKTVRCVRADDADEGTQCLICLEGFELRSLRNSKKVLGSAVRLASCRHVYHFECLEKWVAVDQRCPTCRTPAPVTIDGETLLPAPPNTSLASASVSDSSGSALSHLDYASNIGSDRDKNDDRMLSESLLVHDSWPPEEAEVHVANMSIKLSHGWPDFM